MPDPNTPFGLVTWPGVNSIISCSMTWSGGISPSVAILEFDPQPQAITRSGNLVFTFDDVTITISDCKADFGTIRRDDKGHIVAIHILDRRWKWRFGHYTAKYNTRLKDGSIKTGSTKQHAQQIATDLVDEMGETGYDVSAFPDDVYPEKDYDYTNPAKALAELADQFDLMVQLTLSTNVLQVVQRGESTQTLPTGAGEYVIDESETQNPPEKPTKLLGIGAKDQYEDMIDLEAVGLDNDGTIVPIANLSYIPTAWVNEPVNGFNTIASASDRALAGKTVYKWYRIVETGIDITGYQSGLTRDDILPIIPNRIDFASDGTNKLQKEATVEGIYSPWWTDWYSPSQGYSVTVNQDLPEDITFEIDAELGIVKFNKPMFRWSPGDGTSPTSVQEALLFLNCVVEGDRYEREKILDADDPDGTDPLIVRRPEILRQYDNGTLEQTQADLDAEMDSYLDAAAEQFTATNPKSITYDGWRDDIEMDGQIMQITLSLSAGQPCTMQISKDDEHSVTVPNYRDRRIIEKIRDSISG